MQESHSTMVVLFDGVCNLCNSSVQFIIRRDKKNQFRFAPLQSDYAKRLLAANKSLPPALTSIVLLKGDAVYSRSDAILHICRTLGGVWQLMSIFFIIPRFVRDKVYDLIARNRYRWFGKKEECMVPTKELRERFLA